MWALSSYYPLTLVYFSYHHPTYIYLFIFICCLWWGQQTISINITLVLVRNVEPGFPDGSEGKESSCNAGDTEGIVQSLGQEDSLREEMATHSSNLV